MIRFSPFSHIFGLLALTAGAALTAQAQDLALPQGAKTTASRFEGAASYALPKGPYHNDRVDMAVMDAALTRTAHRLPLGQGQSTQTILHDLKAQVLGRGYRAVFECHSMQCGGFDFRFALDLLPEPEMHVDLADYRYFQASKGAGDTAEVVALMVSASSKYGFVHITHIGQGVGDAARLTQSSKSAEDAETKANFVANQTTVLQGVAFAAGSAKLQTPNPSALADLARWLQAHPAARATLIGHTDTSGNATANSALSLGRATALRDQLIADFGIDATRLSVMARGGDDPVASNDTAAGRAKNRRVEVAITLP